MMMKVPPVRVPGGFVRVRAPHDGPRMVYFRERSGNRVFVRLTQLALLVGRTPGRTLQDFDELNTTRYRSFVPWCAVEANSSLIQLPVWGANPERSSLEERPETILVDANWAIDVVRLDSLGVASVSGAKHFHGNWRGQPCLYPGCFACVWRDVNPVSISGTYGFFALFAHAKSAIGDPHAKNPFIALEPPSTWSYQPAPTSRFDRVMPPSRVLDY